MKKQVAEEETPQEETPKKKREYFTLTIPRFSFQNTPINGFLVLCLVVFAFFLGMLTNKVIYLETVAKAVPTPAANAQAAAPAPTAPPVVKNLGVGKLPLIGNKDAKVTMVEFSDFQCPFCKKFFDDTEKQLHDTYITTGKMKLAYRHYPLSSIHPNAEKAAEAAECANEQGKFWEYHNVLFQNQDTWSPLTNDALTETFTGYIGTINGDTDQFRTCLTSSKYKDAVATDTADGDKVQVDGTPTLFINGVRVVGAVPFSELQKVIDQELKK